MAHPQFADGEDDLQLWRVGANTLNKQLQIADKELKKLSDYEWDMQFNEG
jgi:hypothetical protein